ncbi:phosphocholine-specific phospholipase C [Luteolibacter luteus]|uniref:phospholipase C n=1 Tax=Luteolibacter luteus TaxID=2728835 RepID=A0A858RFL4_9BACT|nr:phospholipase C, phosphocholine-specific [Luteolibacter luteus]QJE95532.1 phospholipase C, phosphocholine-specific [Luteolibacter luteus]
MISRREFLRRASLLSGGLGAMSVVPPSILKAAGIEPAEGSTFLDAEHVVILMQENRSFDHAFGTLRGVRGFDDPRAITIPGGKPVWLQTDVKGDTYAPFGLKIHESSSTWMSCLPHSRYAEVAAGNDGKHDRWLPVMKSGIAEYAEMPLTLGYYDRGDIPFYYAFADAFTVCDQHFCSLQTSTTPNRLYLWTGTSRDPRDPNSAALLSNDEADHDTHPDWPTFPERLEAHGIPWKIYQNEVDFPTGLSPLAASWLANFGDNPMEYFAQYHVEFSPLRLADLQARLDLLQKQLEAPPDAALSPEEVVTRREGIERKIVAISLELERCSPENFAKLPAREQSIHRKAFTTNTGDPAYRELATLGYLEGEEQREVTIPAGDIFHQFRKDVDEGKLPTVSWLVAPENFSDHPSAPWYGAWYVSEVLDILTKNPEVWKKTIFILTYDENDGYFDHVPPFTAPHPDFPSTGIASSGIDTHLEFDKRGNPLGLGYRVPMVIASPWSRGGNVCSEVFDHTSVLQFLELFLSHKTGEEVRETNIGSWRRAVCGDLTSAFRPHGGEGDVNPLPVKLDAFVEGIHRASFMEPPVGFKALGDEEIRDVLENPWSSVHLPRQEPGLRPSCALPYELLAEGKLNRGAGSFEVMFEVAESRSGKKAAGAPFQVYAPGATHPDDAASYTDAPAPLEEARRWAFAVRTGEKLSYSWPLVRFEEERYFLRAYGPNGFFREYGGDASDPELLLASGYSGGRLLLRVANLGSVPLELELKDHAYGAGISRRSFAPGSDETLSFDLTASHRWYDLGVAITGSPRFSRRFAGRVETGEHGMSDPLIGRSGAATAGNPRPDSPDPGQRRE